MCCAVRVESAGGPGGFAYTAMMPDGTFLVGFRGTSNAEDGFQDAQGGNHQDITLGMNYLHRRPGLVQPVRGAQVEGRP
jgi:hypothetical protein